MQLKIPKGQEHKDLKEVWDKEHGDLELQSREKEAENQRTWEF